MLKFWLVTAPFLAMGLAGAVQFSIKPLLAAELLAFLAAALLPFCRGRQCLWVSLLTGIVWCPMDLLAAADYVSNSFSHCPGWVRIAILVQTSGALGSAEVIVCGLLARAIWKRQKRLEV